MKNISHFFLLFCVTIFNIPIFAYTTNYFSACLPDSTIIPEDSNNVIIQDIAADTLIFRNETEFRDFLKYYGLKDYTVLPPQVFTDCTYYPPVSIYPAQLNDDYLNEWRFEGDPFMLIFDHIATRKIFNVFLPLLNDPNVNVCNVNMWLTHPITGQVAQFNDIFNWQDENGKNIFSVNKKVAFLWNIHSGNWSFPIDFVQDSTGYDFTFVNFFPGHDDADLTLNGIDMYTQVIRYKDLDGDGYGNPQEAELAYTFNQDYSDNNEDCNDSISSINPGIAEICNSIDDNCDGAIDNDLPQYYLYADQDDDGYTGDLITLTSCLPFTNSTLNNTDCNDTINTINPSAIEICNQIDDNCNGDSDEGLPVYSYFADLDNDLFGDPQNSTLSCAMPVGFVSDNTDCNDLNAAINTASTEICNSLDDDCNGFTDENLTFYTFYHDADGDGFGSYSDSLSFCDNVLGYISNNSDCNDFNANINPTSTEICNTTDDDCNGLTDENVQTILYRDYDGDSYGNISETIYACIAPEGFVQDNTDCDDALLTFYDADGDGFGNNETVACGVTHNTDCDDTKNAVHPESEEICNTIDDNCDGLIDEGVQTLFYADIDADGFGDHANTTFACTTPVGFVSDATDCDDSNFAINPSNTEICNEIDDDCDGFTDENVQTIFYADADDDSFGDPGSITFSCAAPEGFVTDNTDCNDTVATINSASTEICNAMDDDCDGLTDDEDTYVSNTPTWYADADNDNYGNEFFTENLCSMPSGYVSDATDCNDLDSKINPAETEICNAVDDNCDGVTDEGLLVNFYADTDGDSYGNGSIFLAECSAPFGYVIDNSDCDDSNPSIHPFIPEICNTIDDNCNDFTDEEVQTDYYADTDNDGFGNMNVSIAACSAPAGFVTNNSDCDDNTNSINTIALEICNHIDDNCNGNIDENVLIVYFEDFDGDGFGNNTISTSECALPAGYVLDNSDCNDSLLLYADADNDGVGSSELVACGSITNTDCNDNNPTITTVMPYYFDADNDGDGAGPMQFFCTESAPEFYSVTGNDCDDTNIFISSVANELCNALDDDCDGFIDEDVQTLFYADADADGFGDIANTTFACEIPGGFVIDNTDCNDADAAINPAGSETCNNTDDDCDGFTDEDVQTLFYNDADGDGFGNASITILACEASEEFVSNNSDCNDADTTINPTTIEICNTTDDDCDGLTDENVQVLFYNDSDGDGFGDINNSTLACENPNGFVTDNTDCNDSDATINSATTETCNTTDDDCDGLVDENVQTTFYQDADADGFGNILYSNNACAVPVGFVTDSTDCDDALLTYYDSDGDGFGSNITVACGVPLNTDCNDDDFLISPESSESCNSLDDDCNGVIDEGVQTVFYSDNDDDNFGDAGYITFSCAAPSGYVMDNTDCNDNSADIHPYALEICNNTDDDCNGSIDEGLTFFSYYNDVDSDNYGYSMSAAVISCTSIPGSVTNNLDCNDANSSVHPSSFEICNDIDDDCNGEIDNDLTFTTYYADADSDGFGNDISSVYSCTFPVNYVIDHSDCNDAASTINPSVTDICNGIDDDCNGVIDYGSDFASLSAIGPTAVCTGTSVTLSASQQPGYLYKWYRNEKFSTQTESSTYSTSQKGTYKVEIITADGCSDFSNNIIITNVALPGSSISVTTATDLCITSFVRMKVTFGNGFSYQWYNNESAIPGATTFKYETSVVGTYYCRLTNNNGCSVNSSSVTVTNSCKENIDTDHPEFSVNAYPNPAHEFVNIELNVPLQVETVWVQLYSINGMEVFKTALEVTNSEDNYLLQLPSHIEPGLYGLHFNAGDEEKTIMLILN